MPKSVKKVASKAKRAAPRVTAKSSESTQMVISAVIVVFTVIIAPIAWLTTKSVPALYLIPTVVSVVAAAMFRDLTGKEMTQQFRHETTTITAVFAVVLAVLAALNLPSIELDGSVGTVLPIFMIIFMSVLAIASVLVTVYLPLGMTVSKKK